MSKLSLAFGTPAHGWLHVALTCDGREHVLDASDVPGDSLHMLASAVLTLVSTSMDEASVTWFLEPAEVRWIFRRHGDVHELSIVASRHQAPQRFAAGSLAEIGTPIWRALRRLEADPAWTDPATRETAWTQPFPTKEVALLGEHLRRGRAR